MSVHDELKKAVNRIAQLEQELKVSEDVREQRRDELHVLSEKYEAEKYKAEARSRTIETLQDSLRGVESAYSSDSELWQSTKYDMEAQIHELKTRLQIDPGGGDLIDAQESTIEHLRFQIDRLEGVINMTVARLGGEVEGQPTERLNFLQRIDGLRTIEHCARWLFSDGGYFAKTPQGHEMRRLLFFEGKSKLPKSEWDARKDLQQANDFIEILRAQREGLFSILRHLDRRIAFIGMPQEPKWNACPKCKGSGGVGCICWVDPYTTPDWRKEIKMIREALPSGETSDCPGCHQRRHDCICVDSAS